MYNIIFVEEVKMMLKNVISEMRNDVVVGLDEVVNVFVSKYEEGLFEKKDVVSNKLKSVKSDIDYLIKKLKEVDVSKYEWMKEDIGLKCVLKGVELRWKDGKGVIGICSVVVEINNDGNDWRVDKIGRNIKLDVGKNECEIYFDLMKDEENIKNELFEVMNLIKNVSRKERKIKSKISEMKLKESGYGELLEDREMLKLIEIN